jgi:hypothetical protein
MPKAKDLTADLGKLRGQNLAPQQASPLQRWERKPAGDVLAWLFGILLTAFLVGQGVFLAWLARL